MCQSSSAPRELTDRAPPLVWDTGDGTPHERDGDVYVYVRNLKLQRSTAYEHARNQLHLMTVTAPAVFNVPGTDIPKPALLVLLDGGQDENPRFEGQVLSSTVVFLKRRLQFMMVLTRAGGFSSLGAVERAQCWITARLAGSKFESDHFGKVHRKADGTPRLEEDEALERRNLVFASERVAKVLSAAEGAVAYGRPMRSVVPPASADCPASCSVDEEALLQHKEHGSGGCGCKARADGGRCVAGACRSCAGHTPPVPCVYKCDCYGTGACQNQTPPPPPTGFSTEELKTLPLPELVDRLLPRDIELFASTHGIMLHYCLQLKICASDSCWYCSRFSTAERLENLDWFPIYTKPNGHGGWLSLSERRALLRCPATRQAAMASFLSDSALPSEIIKTAWTKSAELSEDVLRDLAQRTNLQQGTIADLYEKLTDAKEKAARTAEAKRAAKEKEAHSTE
jgi:hypothetical protein